MFKASNCGSIVSYSNSLAAKFRIRKPFRHEVFSAAASDSYGCTRPSMLVRKNGWMIIGLLHQHKRTSRRSVKVYPRCGSREDLMTPFNPGSLNRIRSIAQGAKIAKIILLLIQIRIPSDLFWFSAFLLCFPDDYPHDRQWDKGRCRSFLLHSYILYDIFVPENFMCSGRECRSFLARIARISVICEAICCVDIKNGGSLCGSIF